MKKSDELKNYYSIGEVSKVLGIHEQTIRMYERKNLFSPPRNNKNIRIFSKQDILKLDLIITMTQELKMTYAGVKLVLNLARKLNLSDEDLLDFVIKNKNTFYSG
jgi:MerR family transcriptional regulator/heat shock protein HspR